MSEESRVCTFSTVIEGDCSVMKFWTAHLVTLLSIGSILAEDVRCFRGHCGVRSNHELPSRTSDERMPELKTKLLARQYRYKRTKGGKGGAFEARQAGTCAP